MQDTISVRGARANNLRLLWARVDTPHCSICGKEIQQQTIGQVVKLPRKG